VLVYLSEQLVIAAKIYSNSIRKGPGSWVRIQSRREHSSYSDRIGRGFNVEEVGWIVPGRRAEGRLSFKRKRIVGAFEHRYSPSCRDQGLVATAVRLSRIPAAIPNERYCPT
jgi:hypothetical protein